MMKIIMYLTAWFLIDYSVANAAFDEKPIVKSVAENLEHGELAEEAHKTVNTIVLFSIITLKAHGFHDEAREIRDEWDANEAYFFSELMAKDLGDHRPLSEWLASVYMRLELLLGKPLMAWTHLDDIKVLNFAIPVVFDARMESGYWDSDDPKPEYKLHFVPFSGVVTYWSAYLACTIATEGIGSVWCSPIASVGENAMVHFIAPRISDRVYDFANREN